jgi:hypothetical protein
VADAAVAEKEETEAPTPQAIPQKVNDRIRRGRERMRKKAAQRQLYYKFWRGETYSYVNAKNVLVSQDTVSWMPAGKMPDHRIRNSYPFIASIVQAKVSAATQRVPGYEVVPSTTEPDDAQAADLAAKVAVLRLRRVAPASRHDQVGRARAGWRGGVRLPVLRQFAGPFVAEPPSDDEPTDPNAPLSASGTCESACSPATRCSGSRASTSKTRDGS